MWEVKPYRQNDIRWRGVYLGWSVDHTIGSHGCLITSVAMMLTAMGFDETPLSVNQRLKSLPPGQGFLGARLVWRALERLWPIRLAHVAYHRGAPADTVRIARYLERAPVLIEVQPRAQQFHWVVALETVGKDRIGLPEDFVIRDPLHRGETTLLSRYRVRAKSRIDPLQLAVTAYAAYAAYEPEPAAGRDRSGSSATNAADAEGT